jgi:hypothetical protein
MTTIRKRQSPSSEPLPETPADDSAHLPPGRLRARALSARSIVWMAPAAAGLAGLLVFGLDAASEKPAAVPATVETLARGGPATTGSLTSSTPDAAHSGGAAPVSGPPPANLPPTREGVGSDASFGLAMPPAPAPAPVQAAEGSRIAAVPWVASQPQETRAPRLEASRAPSQPPALKLSPEDVAAHLARGEERLKNGELAAARLYFERVALAGDQRGALGMARTYDPAVLAGLPVLGPQADAALARQWYQRAATQRAGR